MVDHMTETEEVAVERPDDIGYLQNAFLRLEQKVTEIDLAVHAMRPTAKRWKDTLQELTLLADDPYTHGGEHYVKITDLERILGLQLK